MTGNRYTQWMQMARRLPQPLREQAISAILEVERLEALGDATARRMLPQQLLYLARRHNALDAMLPLWRSVQEPV
ncbi:MAG: hypothetical protein KatS3mg051_1527 [Anaerolineae bacterium]|nr:MAG: hypothetical protein KatS3mg051_1527 [Anaerolineae bacterium]